MCQIKHLLLEICRWNLVVGCYCCWWVVACSWLTLLLLVQLLMLVLLLLNDCLSFSSWDCYWLLALLLLEWILSFRFYSMVLLGDLLMCLWCCERTVVFFVLDLCWSVVSYLLWPSSSSPAAVVLPAAPSQSCDWAACVLLAYVLIWSISWTCCEMVWYPSALYSTN
jgi:hypothetical protein